MVSVVFNSTFEILLKLVGNIIVLRGWLVKTSIET